MTARTLPRVVTFVENPRTSGPQTALGPSECLLSKWALSQADGSERRCLVRGEFDEHIDGCTGDAERYRCLVVCESHAERNSGEHRLGSLSSDPRLVIERDLLVGNNESINQHIVRARAPHPGRMPRIEDLEFTATSERVNRAWRHLLIAAECEDLPAEPVSVMAATGPRPTTGDLPPALDGVGSTDRSGRSTNDRERIGQQLGTVSPLQRHQCEVLDANHQVPPSRSIGVRNGLDRLELVAWRRVGAGIRRRRPQSMKSRFGKCHGNGLVEVPVSLGLICVVTNERRERDCTFDERSSVGHVPILAPHQQPSSSNRCRCAC